MCLAPHHIFSCSVISACHTQLLDWSRGLAETEYICGNGIELMMVNPVTSTVFPPFNFLSMWLFVVDYTRVSHTLIYMWRATTISTLTAKYWFSIFFTKLFKMGKILFHSRVAGSALIRSAPPRLALTNALTTDLSVNSPSSPWSDTWTWSRAEGRVVVGFYLQRIRLVKSTANC